MALDLFLHRFLSWLVDDRVSLQQWLARWVVDIDRICHTFKKGHFLLAGCQLYVIHAKFYGAFCLDKVSHISSVALSLLLLRFAASLSLIVDNNSRLIGWLLSDQIFLLLSHRVGLLHRCDSTNLGKFHIERLNKALIVAQKQSLLFAWIGIEIFHLLHSGFISQDLAWHLFIFKRVFNCK